MLQRLATTRGAGLRRSSTYCGWTKSISHHLETMGNHCLLVFSGESSRGAGFRPSTFSPKGSLASWSLRSIPDLPHAQNVRFSSALRRYADRIPNWPHQSNSVAATRRLKKCESTMWSGPLVRTICTPSPTHLPYVSPKIDRPH